MSAASAKSPSERRSSNTIEWIEGLCTEFSEATGWVLKFIPDRGFDQDGFDRRELDWCWHAEITDGIARLGALHLDLPGLRNVALAFESAHRLADLIGNQINLLLRTQRQFQNQSSEIGALIGNQTEIADDFRMRVRALMRASVCLPGFRGAALFVLEPDGRTLRFRMAHQLPDTSIPARRRTLATAECDVQALKKGWSVLTGDSQDAVLFLPEEMKFGLCVAVRNESGPVGTLWLYDRRAHSFDERQIDLVTGLARQIADSFERLVLLREQETTQRLTRELDVVASVAEDFCEVQESFPGCEIAVRSRAHHEVGGDLCELIRLDEHRTVVVIGDGSGDSIPAAMVMTATRGAMHSLLESDRDAFASPDRIVEKINRALVRVTAVHQFISMIVGVIDSRDHSFVFTNAGHPPALHIRGQNIDMLESQGMLLGVVDVADYSSGRTELQPNDLLIMFSDGITEARDQTKKMFREEGVVEALGGDVSGSACQVLERIWSRYETHTGGQNLDDRTLVVVKVTE
ncbi:MAG: PP2C family protein-serine/threonine phosphatase [Planctomycetota bacterium]|jgi:sigma-B regulation protein RsbU (phosphoserine phosphatase)